MPVGRGATAARPVVVVTAHTGADGALGAAAALSCAGAGAARAPLLIDLGGTRPRPTLIATAVARGLEDRLAAALPVSEVAARGGVCHLAVGSDPGALAELESGLALARRSPAVIHAPPAHLAALLTSPVAEHISGALVVEEDTGPGAGIPLLLELMERGLLVASLPGRLDWMSERRALFGALREGDLGALPQALVAWFASYAGRGQLPGGGR
jgi:hypothetical protein